MSVYPKITVGEVADAASVLERLSRIYDFGNPEYAEWSANDLKAEIKHIHEYEEQWLIRERIVELVSEKCGVQDGQYLREALLEILQRYEVTENE